VISAALISALLWVECPTGNFAQRVFEVNGVAHGPLCIHPLALADVNSARTSQGRPAIPLEHLYSFQVSVEVCREYLSIWCTEERLERPPTDEDYARIWVGGPQGYCRTSSLPYWARVRRYLGVPYPFWRVN
jgi:hypothetical protein